MRRDTPAVVLAGLLFVLSGAAALVYQVAWQRLLALHSGVGLYSVAMIVAAFMAGLGIGSHLGGRLEHAARRRGRARRVRARSSSRSARFGAASTWIYYDWLYPRAVHLPSPSWQAGLLHLAALLPPTLLMGMSLPFLVRAVVTRRRGRGPPHRLALRRQPARRGRRRPRRRPGCCCPRSACAGRCSPPPAPTSRSAWGRWACSAARALAGAGAAGAGRGVAGPRLPGGRGPRQPAARRSGSSLYALSGFVALSLEIVWFRLLDVAVKSTAFTFGTVLAVYLLGSASGRSPGASAAWAGARRPLRAFLLTQCAILALAGAAAWSLVWRCSPRARRGSPGSSTTGPATPSSRSATSPTGRRIAAALRRSCRSRSSSSRRC